MDLVVSRLPGLAWVSKRNRAADRRRSEVVWLTEEMVRRLFSLRGDWRMLARFSAGASGVLATLPVLLGRSRLIEIRALVSLFLVALGRSGLAAFRERRD